MTSRILALFLLSLFPNLATSQSINPDLLQKTWKAQWITGPGIPINRYSAASDPALKAYGVVKFRKVFTLATKPTTFIIHVSADNRYKLFVNGKQISQGPARGDLYFWNFETIDIAPLLTTGSNTVAAVVWNDGARKPEAQITFLTGFILQGNSVNEEVLNTDDSWKTIKDESYKQLQVRVPGYYVAGPGELVDMNHHVKGWEKTGFDDSGWVAARLIRPGTPKTASINSTGWMLVPSSIPQMEMTPQRLARTRKTEGIQVPSNFPASKVKVTVPPNTRATILLDQGFLTNAYPTLTFSGGKNTSISMGYSEGLYIVKDEKLNSYFIPELPKGNRDEIEGKVFIGKTDSLVSDGTTNQEYTPLWWRTYRYLRLVVSTKAETLVIDDIYGTFTGYPFRQQAKLETSNTEVNKMLDIGWRTARLCAFETYMDCPYYEQLQYIGDARIQAMVSFYNAGDDGLVRNGLTLMDHSRLPEGITQSRYPTDLKQEIPTFSLWWIAMVHDYYWYRPDGDFVKGKLPGTRQVLSFFESFQQADGSLRNVPYWVFTDWVESKGWDFGMMPKGSNGESAILDLQLMWIYQQAGEMENDLGIKELGQTYLRRAEQLRNTIQKKYWDAGKSLYADTEAKQYFSQHVNSLAILSGMVSGDQATRLAQTMATDATLAQASIYFKYYLHQAYVRAGLGNDYLKWLDKWRENMAMGLTTWAEISDVSKARSDCHAWGSSPNVEFFRTVLGIDSDAPGFARVKITPRLGSIEEISGEMPHPKGTISVKYKVKKGAMSAEIVLPEGVSGVFIWNNRSYSLMGGKNTPKL